MTPHINRDRVIYAALAILFFIGGAYTWKILRTGSLVSSFDPSTAEDIMSATQTPIVMVGETAITGEDLSWEYGLQTEGIQRGDDMTPIPDLGIAPEKELLSLRERLLSDIIERKLLYQFVEQDTSFDIANPRRYNTCLNEWRETIERKELPTLLQGAKNQERLKSRLCEQAILTQYLKERVSTRAKVSESEISEFYKNHREDLVKPERVLLRHILVKEEQLANDIKAKLTPGNFAALAREHSMSPEAAQGGLMGPFGRHDLPQTFDVAFAMGPGQISEVLKSPNGHHIIYVERRYAREEPSFADAHERIRDILLAKQSETEYQKWVERAMKAVSIRTPRTP